MAKNVNILLQMLGEALMEELIRDPVNVDVMLSVDFDDIKIWLRDPYNIKRSRAQFTHWPVCTIICVDNDYRFTDCSLDKMGAICASRPDCFDIIIKAVLTKIIATRGAMVFDGIKTQS